MKHKGPGRKSLGLFVASSLRYNIVMTHVRHLAFLSLFVPVFAFAAPENKSEFNLAAKDIFFQPGGGIRLRYENLREATGGAFSSNESEAKATHRAQFDFKLYKGEYFETFFRLLHVDEWGSSSSANGDSSPGTKDGFTSDNALLVNQAYGLWKVSDSLGLQFGRSPIKLGRGLTYGENDWFNVPTTFDNFAIKWDWEVMEFSAIAAKTRDLSPVAGQTLSPDPEENHYILDFDIKNMSDSISVFDIHFAQVNRDEGSADGGTTVLSGLNMQRFAFDFEYRSRSFYTSLFASYVSGKERAAGSMDLTIKQIAGDLEVGYILADTSQLHFWAGFHHDSGDKDATDSTSETYDSFYYDVYGRSGRMDLLRWGNLNFYRLGLDAKLFTNVTLGGEWLSFRKTEQNGGLVFGAAGAFLNSNISSGNMTLATETNIGEEFDIWLDVDFTSGVFFRATFTTFFPGAVFEKATTTSGNSASNTMYQGLTQVGFFF
ncbi:MAG: alginate export family protein [Bdellovibrionales bacterium]|nr:alginate export family protein [Bdellovibrionales bacterium]